MATMMKTQYRKTEVAWWEEERKATATETPFFDLADFAREKRREEEYQSALVDVFEQIALSPKPRKHEPPKEEPKNDLVNLPDIYAVAQTAPAPIVDWPLIDDHHRNKNTNPFLEDELMGKKERLLDQAIDSAKADTIFLGAFSDEPVTLPPKTAPLVFESPKERKKQEKLAKKKEKQARKNSKKAAKYADSLDSRTLFASDSVAVTHVKKGTGKTKRGRIQITGKDEIDDFPDTEPELRDTLDMMLPPAVIRKEYTGSSSSSGNSSEDDVVQWWNEDVPKEKKTRDVAARRKRTGSAKEVDNSELEARAQRKRALSLPLSRSHGSLKSTKEERLKEKEIKRREKEEAKMKEKEAKLKEKEAAKVKSPRKLSGKEKRALVPSYNAESSMAY